jgi:carbonic anhydrase
VVGNNKSWTVSRRGLIAGIAITLAGPLVLQASASTSDNIPVSPDEAFQRLIDGNARYVTNSSINTDHSAGRATRALASNPLQQS